jgi:prepilin-type N-terminal cleavage/methylation domain-containing protein
MTAPLPQRASRQNARKANGFSLVETLVATAIIAGGLGATYQVVGTGARQTRIVEDRRLAILVAQSQLAAVGAARNNSFGETRGVTDGMRWRITIKPWRGGGVSAVRLEDVSVTTGLDSDGRDLFTVHTIRVAR